MTATLEARPQPVPFIAQHRIAEKIANARGDISIRCTCGETCTGLGTEGGARVAHQTHMARAGRLTVTQLKVMLAGAQDPAGWLPPNAPTRTEQTLTDRGLIEPVGDAAPGRTRVTGAGLGVLAEHRLRTP